MLDYEEDSRHPLYPNPNATYRRIHLYPPRECDSCAQVSHEVEWHEIVKTETGSLYIEPDTTFQVSSYMRKLCKKCFKLENSDFVWG